MNRKPAAAPAASQQMPHRPSHDPESHEMLRLSIVNMDGRTLGQPFTILAPENRNSAAALRLRVEILHRDGCAKIHHEQDIPAYW